MITVTINDKEVQIEKPVTILEAAKIGGIRIPTLCYLEGLEKFGGCRLCLVEVEKLPKLQTACTVMVTDGMVVRTETEPIIRARRAMLEFLLINHPLECPYCDKAGECDLQDLVAQYGPESGRFAEGKRKHPESFDDPIIVRNMERCIACTRCVRMCDAVQGAHAITVTGRGGHTFIEPFSGGRYDCEYCGNCLTVCPVGAIMSRLHRHSYRPWFVEKEVQTVCGYCGVGCSLIFQMRENTILRAIPKIGVGINKGLLCSRGRFGYDVVESNKRLVSPLARKNGELKPVSWEEAIAVVSERLKVIVEKEGGKAIAGIASPRCTNESNYVFQRFFREVLKTNNIDSISRMFYAPAQAYLEGVFGQGITANIMSGIRNAEAVIVAGGDPAKINPVLGLQVRSASRKGAKIIALCDAEGLKWFIHRQLAALPGSENLLYALLLKALLDERGLPGQHAALEEKINAYRWPEEKDVLQGTGLNSSDIKAIAEELKELKNVAFIIGPDVILYGGLRGLFLLSGIMYLLDARVYLLSERPNEQGVIDMGCLPDMLVGGRPLAISSFRDQFGKEMGYHIPVDEGLSLYEMFDGMANAQIKAAYIMGDNPVFNHPGAHRMREALSKLDFLVVQDTFLSETAQMADVVLPATTWAEQEGTFVNLERRIQRLNKTKSATAGMDDWLILTKIAGRMGGQMEYGSVEEVWDEATRASHLYGSLSYDDLDTDKSLWPYSGEPLRGRETEVTEGEEGAGFAQTGYCVIPEKSLFHSGTLSRYSPALNSIQSEPFALIGKNAAAELGVGENDKIRISSDGRSLELVCKIDETVQDLGIRVPNVFEGVCAMTMIECGVEPVTKAAVRKPLELKVEKVA